MHTITKRKPLTMTQFDELSQYLEQQPCCQHDNHTFHHTVVWLKGHNRDVLTNLEKFTDLLCNCDCDLLLLQDETFEAQRDEPIQGLQVHGAKKWEAAIMEAFLEAS